MSNSDNIPVRSDQTAAVAIDQWAKVLSGEGCCPSCTAVAHNKENNSDDKSALSKYYSIVDLLDDDAWIRIRRSA